MLDIAVLIPAFNGHERLPATLNSLRGQRAHVVLVDDGSIPPLTVDAGQFDFPITVLRLPQNQGIERALNAGLRYIVDRGYRFVARLDNGDIAMPDRLRRQQEFLDRHPRVGLVGAHVTWVDESGRSVFTPRMPLTHEAIARSMRHTVCLIHPSVMLRTTVLESIGFYSHDYPAAEDFELFMRLMQVAQVANLPDVLVRTRYDRRGISIARRRRQLFSKLRIQLRFFSWRHLLSYVGVAKTAALLLLPYRLVSAAKSLVYSPRIPGPTPHPGSSP